MSNAHSLPRRPVIARLIRVLSIPIILFWVLLAVALGMLTPSLDAVAGKHSVSLAPHDSPGFQSMMNIGAGVQAVRFRLHRDGRVGGPGQARRQRAPVLQPDRRQV